MTGSITRLEADNIRLQRADDKVLMVGHIKTLGELQLKMEDEIVSGGIHKILYQERLVYAYFSLDKQVGLKTIFNLAVSQDLSFDIHLGGKRLPSSAVSHLVTSGKITDTCLLVNMLAIVKAQSENVHEQKLHIDALVDSLAVAIEEESTLDERIIGKLFFLTEQLRLATISLYGRRYSSSLLAYTLVWENSSPLLYKQMLKENVVVSTFHSPPAQHVKDLLHGHRTNWQHPLLHGYENQANFRTRAACIVLIDEIYTAQRVE